MLSYEMEPQVAIEQPRVATYNFPSSNDPHAYHPGVMRAEGRLSSQVIQDLRRIGHTVEIWPDWIATAGAPCAIRVDRERAILLGGADPRRMSYVIGW
jgi:gamma-glutamyltranspeptidase/glutathione hydrolase